MRIIPVPAVVRVESFVLFFFSSMLPRRREKSIEANDVKQRKASLRDDVEGSFRLVRVEDLQKIRMKKRLGSLQMLPPLGEVRRENRLTAQASSACSASRPVCSGDTRVQRQGRRRGRQGRRRRRKRRLLLKKKERGGKAIVLTSTEVELKTRAERERKRNLLAYRVVERRRELVPPIGYPT